MRTNLEFGDGCTVVEELILEVEHEPDSPMVALPMVMALSGN